MTRLLNLPYDINISVQEPYTEGYVLTAIEAAKLNQVYADGIRSSLMHKIKKIGDETSRASIGEFQNFADSYSFAERTAKAPVDPVTKEANKIAKEQVFAAIRKKGGNPADYSSDQISDYVTKVLAHKPEIMKEAARRIDSSRKIAGDLLDDLLDEAA